MLFIYLFILNIWIEIFFYYTTHKKIINFIFLLTQTKLKK